MIQFMRLDTVTKTVEIRQEKYPLPQVLLREYSINLNFCLDFNDTTPPSPVDIGVGGCCYCTFMVLTIHRAGNTVDVQILIHEILYKSPNQHIDVVAFQNFSNKKSILATQAGAT